MEHDPAQATESASRQPPALPPSSPSPPPSSPAPSPSELPRPQGWSARFAWDTSRQFDAFLVIAGSTGWWLIGALLWWGMTSRLSEPYGSWTGVIHGVTNGGATAAIASLISTLPFLAVILLIATAARARDRLIGRTPRDLGPLGTYLASSWLCVLPVALIMPFIAISHGLDEIPDSYQVHWDTEVPEWASHLDIPFLHSGIPELLIGTGCVITACWLASLAPIRASITDSRACPKCGYERAGLAMDAVCPECGHPSPATLGSSPPRAEIITWFLRPDFVKLRWIAIIVLAIFQIAVHPRSILHPWMGPTLPIFPLHLLAAFVLSLIVWAFLPRASPAKQRMGRLAKLFSAAYFLISVISSVILVNDVITRDSRAYVDDGLNGLVLALQLVLCSVMAAIALGIWLTCGLDRWREDERQSSKEAAP